VQREIRDAKGQLHVSAGVEQPLQFFLVRTGDRAQAYLVVDVRGVADHSGARTAAAERFGSAGCVLLIGDGERRATIDHDLDGQRMEVAAAVAYVHHYAEWDRWESMVVGDRDSHHEVSIELDDDGPWAVVTPHA
jgi:hypothetical protein